MKSKRQNSLPSSESSDKNQKDSENQELTFKKVCSAVTRGEKPSLYVATLKNQAISLTPKASSRDTREKVLVLDLDHTLMCNFRSNETQIPGVACPIKVQGRMYMFTLVKRPGLEKFLYEVSKYYRLMIYTTSLEEYAISVLKALGILPLFEKIFHRDYCQDLGDGVYMKNLKNIGEPLENLVFVDDSMKQVTANALNALPIVPFNGDLNDKNLIKLIPFLVNIGEKADVRPVFQQYLKYCKVETRTSSRLPTRNEARAKFSKFRATSCSPDHKRQATSLAENMLEANLDLANECDYETSDNSQSMPTIKLLEPKFLGSPTMDEKMNSFTDLYNHRLSEQKSLKTKQTDDFENDDFVEDDDETLFDATPRLMGNLSTKSPMHSRKRHQQRIYNQEAETTL